MTHGCLRLAASFRDRFGPFQRVLDVGSLDVNGSVRGIFSGSEYMGLDRRYGPNVDWIMDAKDLIYSGQKFDAALCLSTLEHDQEFWLSLAGIRSVLKDGGAFCVAVPGIGFKMHEHPGDFYRFTAQAVREVLLAKMTDVAVFDPLGRGRRTPMIGGWGRK